MKRFFFSLLLLFVFVEGSAQNQKSVPLKKLSEIQTERERCLYFFDLADAGIFEKKTWPELRQFFDLGYAEHSVESGKQIIVYLTKQISDRSRLSKEDVSARAYIGWYVIFDVASGGGIEKFMITNFHK